MSDTALRFPMRGCTSQPPRASKFTSASTLNAAILPRSNRFGRGCVILQTLRYKRFAKPAFITTEGRKPILNLVIAMQKRAWIQGLSDAAKTIDLPAEFKPLYSP